MILSGELGSLLKRHPLAEFHLPNHKPPSLLNQVNPTPKNMKKTPSHTVVSVVSRACLFLCCCLFSILTQTSWATPPLGYSLVWADEFNGTALDTNKWDYRYLTLYSDISKNGVSVTNGLLSMTTYTENGTNYWGMISTEKSFNPRYGYAEASIQFFGASGVNDAFWMQSPKVGNVGNPHTNGVEMDIVEDRWYDSSGNNISNQAESNVHWDGYGTSEQSISSGLRGTGLATGFHTYAVEWAPNFQKYYIDGQFLWLLTNSTALDPVSPQFPVSQTNEYMIFDNGLTSWAGPAPTGGYGSLATSTTKMNVDYVRYYQFPANMVPPPPDTVTAAATNTQVTVKWAPTVSATSYNVKRSTVSGGPYTTIATGVAAPASSDTVAPTIYVDTSVVNGTTYYYVVSAVNTTGEGTNSTEVIATPTGPTPPPAPTGLAATGGNAIVNLVWTQSTGTNITQNNVYRSTTGSGGPYNLLASLAATTSYADTAVVNGNTYFYSVSAVNGSGESALSAYAGATPQVSPPAAPTGLTATAGNNQVALSWTASTGATSYNVKRATVSGGPYTTIATGVSSTSYTDATAVNGTTYYYVVSAVNAGGESANSSEVSATPVAPANPNAPTSLTTGAGHKKVTLTWTQSTSANITTNNVYRSTTSGGPYTLVASLPATTSYANTGLATGTTYYFVVTAVNSTGLESSYSNEAGATAK